MSCSDHSGVCLCTGGRRVRGFCPASVFQPWEYSRLVVAAVQGAPILALSTPSMTGVASGPDRQENGDHDEPKRLHVNKFSGMRACL